MISWNGSHFEGEFSLSKQTVATDFRQLVDDLNLYYVPMNRRVMLVRWLPVPIAFVLLLFLGLMFILLVTHIASPIVFIIIAVLVVILVVAAILLCLSISRRIQQRVLSELGSHVAKENQRWERRHNIHLKYQIVQENHMRIYFYPCVTLELLASRSQLTHSHQASLPIIAYVSDVEEPSALEEGKGEEGLAEMPSESMSPLKLIKKLGSKGEEADSLLAMRDIV